MSKNLVMGMFNQIRCMYPILDECNYTYNYLEHKAAVHIRNKFDGSISFSVLNDNIYKYTYDFMLEATKVGENKNSRAVVYEFSKLFANRLAYLILSRNYLNFYNEATGEYERIDIVDIRLAKENLQARPNYYLQKIATESLTSRYLSIVDYLGIDLTYNKWVAENLKSTISFTFQYPEEKTWLTRRVKSIIDKKHDVFQMDAIREDNSVELKKTLTKLLINDVAEIIKSTKAEFPYRDNRFPKHLTGKFIKSLADNDAVVNDIYNRMAMYYYLLNDEVNRLILSSNFIKDSKKFEEFASNLKV